MGKDCKRNGKHVQKDMQNLLRQFVFVAPFFVLWRILLNLFEWISSAYIYHKRDFLGVIPWANFDGSHYLVIALQGYLQYQQAFFPFFPLLIHILTPPPQYMMSGIYTALIFVHVTFLTSLFLLWQLVRLDYNKKSIAMWAIIFLLTFPTSFFFGSIYTESLFLMLVLGSFYAARKKKWFLASILGGFASATKFVGIFLLPALIWEWWEQRKISNFQFPISNFVRQGGIWLLLIPIGLISYMIYLEITVGDPLAFIHVQPAFGANRTGGEIVLLPQVLFRYLKIFATVDWIEYDARIAMLEFFTFTFVFSLLVISWKTIRKSYLIFSLLAILAPTLTGSLSSMPRYILVAFPFFIILAAIKHTGIKLLLAASFLFWLGILTMLFSGGYFVS